MTDEPAPTPDTTLTTKLHAAADRDLKQRIEKAADEFHHAVNGSAYIAIRRSEGAPEQSLRDVMAALTKSIVTALTDSNRKTAVDAFIAKVESLDAQLDELQGQINHL